MSDSNEPTPPSDRLPVTVEGHTVRLDDATIGECQEHPGCVRFVEHYAIEMHARAGAGKGVYVEPSGVVRVEVHAER